MRNATTDFPSWASLFRPPGLMLTDQRRRDVSGDDVQYCRRRPRPDLVIANPAASALALAGRGRKFRIGRRFNFAKQLPTQLGQQFGTLLALQFAF